MNTAAVSAPPFIGCNKIVCFCFSHVTEVRVTGFFICVDKIAEILIDTICNCTGYCIYIPIRVYWNDGSRIEGEFLLS